MSTLIPCTVQVLTRNSQAGIESCLQSLTQFAEVLVQDGYSTDQTRTIAQTFSNVRIMDQNKTYLNNEGRIINFAAMRNESINAATYDWIFVVDGDEHVQPEIVNEVRTIVENNIPGIHQAFRRFVINGERIMRSAFYPAYQIRLFHRSCTSGYTKPIHERLVVNTGVELQLLDHELTVPLLPTNVLQKKFDRYLEMEVQQQLDITYPQWLKWVLLRNLRSIVGLSLRMLYVHASFKKSRMMPVSYEFQYMRHSFRLIGALFPPAVRRYAKANNASHTSST